MVAMKPTNVFLFFAICGLLAFAAADLTFSISSSQTPNLEYEVDAVECMQEAYVLYPDNDGNKRSEAISKLFLNRHTEKNGWNIAEGCTSSYTPNSTVFIEVLVQDDNGQQSVVKIFN